MSNFQYLVDKINNASFINVPFKHIYLENFFNENHIAEIKQATEINVPKFSSSKDMIDTLSSTYNYDPHPFPGCTTNVKNYLHWLDSGEIHKGIKKDQELLEGFGIALRLESYKTTLLEELIDFFNSIEWHTCLKEKFEKTGHTKVDTAIQKYLTGYEISPHPDIRRKCLTYMININPSDESENLNLHTYFMELVENKKWIYRYWAENLDTERCWIPWDWASPCFNQKKNNSITVFAPTDDTIHAVKLNYDHCKFQRTQFYGNLWYSPTQLKPSSWKDLEQIGNGWRFE